MHARWGSNCNFEKVTFTYSSDCAHQGIETVLKMSRSRTNFLPHIAYQSPPSLPYFITISNIWGVTKSVRWVRAALSKFVMQKDADRPTVSEGMWVQFNLR